MERRGNGRDHEPDLLTNGCEEGGSRVIRDRDSCMTVAVPLQGHIEGCWRGCFFRAEEERGVRSYLHKSVTVEPDLQTDLQRVEGKMRFVVSGTRPLETY